jgi:amidohydrolase
MIVHPRSIAFALMCGFAAVTARAEFVRATYRADLATAVDAMVTRSLADMFAFYKDLHSNPELSLHEVRSSNEIGRRLRDVGFDVTMNVGGHGVVGVMRNGDGPVVMIRGDLDALPITEDTGLEFASRKVFEYPDGRRVGVMHACGHDVHQTCLVGTANVLAELREKWSGTLLVVAQPAEEIGRGAKMMIDDGLFERFPKPNYCLALHVKDSLPAGTVAYTSGWALANVDSVDVTIYGRSGHGSKPHLAVDPIVAAAQTIVALQTVVSRRVDPLEQGVISVGSVHAGSKHNIIPNDAKLQITVRSYTDETRQILLDGIREVTVNTCRAMGCERDPDVVVSRDEFTPATYNDPHLVKAAVTVLKKVVRADRVLEIPPVMGGEDFGRYGKHLNVPSFMFWIGAVEQSRYESSLKPGGEPLPSIHSSKFAPDAEKAIATGVRSMTSVALSLFQEKE